MNQPHIKNNNLVIPFDCDQKYHWWRGGQSVLKTLEELNASERIVKKYRHDKGVKK